jgi:hypothetical protein
VAWLNGLPQKVDVCSGPKEIISKLKYGALVSWPGLDAGSYEFTIRKAALGKCKGKKLATFNKTFVGGEDYTLVAWKPFARTKLRKYVNDIGVPADKATMTFRHAARNPAAADVWLWEHVLPAVDEWPPTIKALKRGGASPYVAVRPGQFTIDVFATKRTKLFTYEGYWGKTQAATVSETYLLGTNKKNSKIVRVWQDGVIFIP